MKCPTCESCEYTQYCGATEIMRKCERHKKLDMTNEEWFNGLATEEKAKRIINIAVNSDCDYRTIVEWLKQPHTTEER